MATILTDNFTDTAATVLSSHTADSGATYTRHPSYTSATLVIAVSGTALDLTSASNNAAYYASPTPATADYNIQAVFIVGAGTPAGTQGFTVRMDVSANTMYWVQYVGGALRIVKTVAGSTTSISSRTLSWASGSTHTVLLRMSGSTFAVDVDGAQVIPVTAGTFVTDTAITAAGKAGWRSTTGSTFITIDSMVMNDTAATGTNYTETGIAAGTVLTSQGQSNAQAMTEAGRLAVTSLASTGETDRRAMQELGVLAAIALSSQGQTTAQAMQNTGVLAVSTLVTIGETDSISHGNSYDETGRAAATALVTTAQQTNRQAMVDGGGTSALAITGGTSTYTPINPPSGAAVIVMLPEFE